MEETGDLAGVKFNCESVQLGAFFYGHEPFQRDTHEYDSSHATGNRRLLSRHARPCEFCRSRHRKDARREIARPRSFRKEREHQLSLTTAKHRAVSRGYHHSTEVIMSALYLLALIVVFLVIYLFYAVINPERF